MQSRLDDYDSELQVSTVAPDPAMQDKVTADNMTDTTSGSTYGMLEARDVGVLPQVLTPWKNASGGAHYKQGAQQQSKTTTYVVAVCVILLAVLSLLGGILNVGDHLMAANGILGALFYVLILVAVIVGVVIPLIKVAKRPVFSLYQLRDESGHARKRHCRMLADNLICNADLSQQEIEQVEGFLEAGDESDDLLIEFYKDKFIPKINEQTKQSATTAFLVSMVSRSPLVETVTMLSISLDLVRSIVETCGFRPTNLGLMRIYSRVMLSALIAGGIEDSDLSDLLGNMLGGGAGARAGGMLLGSATGGLVSAFLVFRVGVITKRWLCAEDGPAQMATIRKTSYKEALSMMRTSGFMATVAEVVKKTAANVASNAGDAVVTAAKNAAQGATNAVVGVAKTAAQGATTAVTEAAHSAGSTFSQAATAAVDGMASMANTATSAVVRTANATAEAAAHAAGSAVGGVQEFFKSAKDSLSKLFAPDNKDDTSHRLE